jgi:hypothetical protein
VALRGVGIARGVVAPLGGGVGYRARSKPWNVAIGFFSDNLSGILFESLAHTVWIAALYGCDFVFPHLPAALV